MAKKYTYTATFSSYGSDVESFSAVEFDSFDEAKKVVDKAVYERKMVLKQEVEAKIKVGQDRPKVIVGNLSDPSRVPSVTPTNMSQSGDDKLPNPTTGNQS